MHAPDHVGDMSLRVLQVQGLRSEYERLRSEHEDGQSGLKGADRDQAAKQTASLQAAQKQNEEMQVGCGACMHMSLAPQDVN